MLLTNAGPGQVVVVYLDRVAVLSGKIPGDDLRNLFLRLWGASTAIAIFDAGRVVENVDDVPNAAVQLHSIHLDPIVEPFWRGR